MRVSYVKVAEYQRRGLVHLHVVIRLDRAMPAYRAHELQPPTAPFDVELLERALRATMERTSAPLPHELGGGNLRWGNEIDVRPLGDGPIRGEIAGYLAEYATRAPNRPAASSTPSPSPKSTRYPSASTSGCTCAKHSRSPPTRRSQTGASRPARTSSATAGTA